MPTYHYQCPTCSHDFQIKRSITESSLTVCPECGSDGLQQVYYPVLVFDVMPRTLGGQADRNYARAGCYEREARHQEIEQARTRAKMDPRMMPPGGESIRKEKPDSPWWRPGTKEIDPSLVRADSATKRRYLEKGDI